MRGDMKMTHYTLPIKCSTVKKADSVAWILFSLMIGVAGGLFIPAFYYFVLVYGKHGEIGLVNISCLVVFMIATVVDIMVGFVHIGDVVRFVNKRLPTFDCIKDEVEE
jgi:hypothetical protein